ncbi:MAG: hypothetical protein AMXMBFR50_08220 [Ignavibacterium album]|jgi:hypothetical protein
MDEKRISLAKYRFEKALENHKIARTFVRRLVGKGLLTIPYSNHHIYVKNQNDQFTIGKNGNIPPLLIIFTRPI